jgi:aspartyl-tRNA(Asn)/glutamyl-tRNA(Gln) amidotransferase subunit A
MSADPLLDGAVADLARAVRTETVSAGAVAEAALARIAARDGTLHAFLSVDRAGALASAAAVDAAVAAHRDPGPLAGVPVAVKDVLCTRGLATTAGSRFLEGWVPPYDAAAVARLRAAGAVVLGKTNCDEFAMGSSTEHSAYGPTRNPHDPTRTPGGSSGGSAAAVAAGLTPLALGSDTGGSIRQPAALTGTVGLKPTYGRVSRFGLIAFGSSLDQVGPHARTVADAALALDVLAGADPRDPTSVAAPVPAHGAALHLGVAGLRLGVPRAWLAEGCDPAVRAAVEAALAALRDGGATLVDVDLPHAAHAVATYYVVAPAEAASNLARFDGLRYGRRAAAGGDLAATIAGSRREGFGPEVRRRILLGTFALSAGYAARYYQHAQRVRALVARDFAAAFARCDAIVGPTTPTPAFRLGEKLGDPLAMYLCDVYTVGANLAGLPGLSVPCGFSSPAADAPALPIGLQILGPAWSEPLLCRIGAAVERQRGGRA